MIYALDTNTISFLLRAKQNPEVASRFEAEIAKGSDYVIPPLSYYEIMWYLIRKKAVVKLSWFYDFCQNALLQSHMDEADLLLAAQIKATPIPEKTIYLQSKCDKLTAAKPEIMHDAVNKWRLKIPHSVGIITLTYIIVRRE